MYEFLLFSKDVEYGLPRKEWRIALIMLNSHSYFLGDVCMNSFALKSMIGLHPRDTQPPTESHGLVYGDETTYWEP
jgi:hypothetical protein